MVLYISVGHILRTAIGITVLVLLLVGEAGEVTPTIEFTYVLLYGSFDDLQGKVTNVTPDD